MIIFLISHRNHVVIPLMNCLIERVQMRGQVQMRGHNIRFYAE